MIYNITAATGQLGTFMTTEILKYVKPEELVLSVRTPKKADHFKARGVTVKKADYYSVQELTEAFTATDVLIYIPSITSQNLKRLQEFENAIHAAEKANVKHFIFVGFMADQENNPFMMSPFFGYVPRRLATTNLQYTYIRNAMYADPLVPYIPELVQRKRLPYPAGDGKISFISREDIAKAVIQIALKKELQGKRYTLTSTKAYSMVELASLLSHISGNPIKYDPMSVKEFTETYDQPEGFGTVLASLYVAAAKHLMGEVTNDFQQITGHTPEELPSYINKLYKG